MDRLIVLLFCVVSFHFVHAQSQGPTAQQILQRAIRSSGGEKRIDSVNGTESMYRYILSKKDTLSVAVKRKDNRMFFLSVLGSSQNDSILVYKDGKAFIRKGNTVANVDDGSLLEELALQSFVSRELGYLRLGYKLERLADQRYGNTFLFTVKTTSPSGQTALNYYEKTGEPRMIAWPNGDKQIVLDVDRSTGLALPSKLISLDTMQLMTQVDLSMGAINNELDSNWFSLQTAGTSTFPQQLKTGNFVYVGAEQAAVITRDETRQVEKGEDSNIEYKVEWVSPMEYRLYDLKDPSSLPATANIGEVRVKISSWAGRRYYCHFITSLKDGGTCVFERRE